MNGYNLFVEFNIFLVSFFVALFEDFLVIELRFRSSSSNMDLAAFLANGDALVSLFIKIPFHFSSEIHTLPRCLIQHKVATVQAVVSTVSITQ